MSEMLNLDAGESIFFTRELETIRAKSYDIKYDDQFKMLGLLPISTDGDPLAVDITHRSYGRVGIAKMGGGDYATDYPSVDVFGTEQTVKVHPVKASYKFNKDEIARASKLNKPLEQMRANAARKAIDKKLNDVAMLGDADTGAKGLFNATGITEVVLTEGATGTSTKWSTKTVDEILKDLYAIGNAVTSATAGYEVPDTLALPRTAYQFIEQKRLDATNEKTILTYFLENSKSIQNVVWFNELEAQTGLGGEASYKSDKVMFCWKNDADHLVLDMPMPFTQEEIWVNGLEYTVPCRAKTAGVTVFYPLSIAYARGI